MTSAVFEILKTYKKAAIALVIFAVYSAAVLWLHVDSQARLEADVLDELRLETEKQGAAISRFFSERRTDLLDLAASLEIEDYFSKGDRNRSPSDGKGLGTQAIEARFKHQWERRRLAETPIYLGLALVDGDDRLIALLGQSEAENPHREAMRFADKNDTAVATSADRRRILFTAPVRIKGSYHGQMVAWSRIETINQVLAEGRQTGLASNLISANALPALREGVNTPLPPELRKSLAGLLRVHDYLAAEAASHRDSDPIVAVVRIGMANSPFSLVTPISDRRIAEHAMPHVLLILAGLIPLVVLAISFLDLLERSRSDALREAANLELKRSAQARDNALANISHQLRTPLNGVLGLAQIGYRDNSGRPDVLDIFARILDSGKRLLIIVNNIVDSPKIEVGKPSLTQAPDGIGGSVRELGSGATSRTDPPHPLAPVSEAVPAAQALPVPITSKPRLSGIRILAAEDDEVNRLVLEDMLTVEGAKVTLVENGRQAVEAALGAEGRSYDLVLMDIQMPEMDGYAAAINILRQLPDMPIIALTAHASSEEREHSHTTGMIDHLTKPVTCETLVASVLRHARPSPPPVKPADIAAESGVDWEALRARYAQRPEFLQKLLVTARSNLAGATAGLRTALSDNDSDRLVFLAHSLKGAASNLMASGLASQACAAELACRGRTAEAKDLAASLAAAAEAVREEIQQQMAIWDIDIAPPKRNQGTTSSIGR